MLNRTVLFIGPPGSGKTTQAALLAEAFGLPHLSMGDEIRRLRALGAKLSFDRRSGLLTAPSTRWVIETCCSPGQPSVIDGIPRAAEQVPLLVEMGIQSTLVFALEVDFPEAMSRMRGRGRHGEDPGVIAMRHSEHQRRSEGLLTACREAGWAVYCIDANGPAEAIQLRIRSLCNEECEKGG